MLWVPGGEFLKELDLVEARSTSVPKIFRAMRQNGSREPIFESDEDRTWFLVRLPVHERASLTATEHENDHVTGQDTQKDNMLKRIEKPHDTLQVTEHVECLITTLAGKMNRVQLQETMKLRDRSHFIYAYLEPVLNAGLIEMTLPDQPAQAQGDLGRGGRTARPLALLRLRGDRGARQDQPRHFLAQGQEPDRSG